MRVCWQEGWCHKYHLIYTKQTLCVDAVRLRACVFVFAAEARKHYEHALALTGDLRDEGIVRLRLGQIYLEDDDYLLAKDMYLRCAGFHTERGRERERGTHTHTHTHTLSLSLSTSLSTSFSPSLFLSVSLVPGRATKRRRVQPGWGSARRASASTNSQMPRTLWQRPMSTTQTTPTYARCCWLQCLRWRLVGGCVKWGLTHRDTETQRHRDTETQRHRDTDDKLRS